jgi:hypothetical protein
MSVADEERPIGKSVGVISDSGGPSRGNSLEGRPRKSSFGRSNGGRTETDTGRQDEYSQARERTLLKELGKFAP